MPPRVTTAVLVALLLTPTASPAETTPDEYDRLVSLARRRQVRRAVDALVEWPPAAVAKAAEGLIAIDRHCTDTCRAAVLLHTEAAFTLMLLGHPAAEQVHLDAADALMPPPESAAETATDDFDLRRRLAVGYAQQQLGRPAEALRAYQQVLKRRRDDPEALVALGSLHEYVAQSASDSFALRTGLGLGDAARHYERALAAQPGHLEARLRLGRVSLLRGRDEDARRELTRVAAAEKTGPHAALARLFLGELAERERHLDEAIEHYRAAAACEPRLQPAHLALSHALQLAGRGAEATRLLQAALAQARGAAVYAWNGYHTSLLHGFREAMDRLWTTVRR